MSRKHARPKRNHERPGPSISVCMIVRNEAHQLRDCLQPLRPCANELIVVDTGSTDNTVEVARSLGATVYYFPWVGDFAAARNESIRHASGDWIFWLDADDRLDAAAVGGLRAAVESGRADAYICSVRSTVAGGADELTEHVRLFRNGMGISFYGRIHETVVPSIQARGLKLAHMAVEIRHTGYGDKATIEAKSRRNLAIVEDALKEGRDELDLLFYRSQSRFNLDQRAEARADLQEFLVRTRTRNKEDLRRIWALGMLLRILDEQGERQAFDRALVEALADFPDQPYFVALRARLDLVSGNAAQAMERLNLAEKQLRTAKGFSPSPVWLAQTRCECCLGLHDFEGARRAARAALALDPAAPKSRCLLISADILQGHFAAAEDALAQLLPSTSVEPWITLYDLRCRQGRLDEAAEAVEQAVSCGLDGTRAGEFRAALERRAAHALAQPVATPLQKGLDCLEGDDWLTAAEWFATAIEAAPTDPQPYRCLAVALDKLGQEEQALEAWRLADHWSGSPRS